METLLLSDEEVRELISMSDVISVVEEAFREKGLGRVQMLILMSAMSNYAVFHHL